MSKMTKLINYTLLAMYPRFTCYACASNIDERVTKAVQRTVSNL